MVAIITGNGTGLERSSAWVLGSRGQLGSATLGRDGEGVYVNAANGNLVITRQDEFLLGKGPDSGTGIAYNSQGNLSDDNGDNWKPTPTKCIWTTGTTNGAGSIVTRRDWDGSETVFSYDVGLAKYVSKEGEGAYDTISYNGEWHWVDGESRVDEYYSAAENYHIKYRTDTDGNRLTYTYTAGKLVNIATQNGESTQLVYSGNNLTELTTYASGTLTRVHYAYDGSNRLATVTVDLSPNDNVVTDGNVYVTTYTYDGSSKRVASIAQADRSLISFTYVLVGADYKVASYTQTVAAGVTRTTSFDYSVAGRTIVTDPAGQKTILFVDANKNLTQISYPPENANTTPRVVQFAYNSNGDVTSAALGPGNVITYSYDSNGNLLTERDSAGNSVSRTYGAKNELLTETRYLVPDPDGYGSGQPGTPVTTRYAYDSENHLRYVVSAEGFVTQYEYDTPGQQTAANEYPSNAYNIAGLAENVSIAESTLTTFVSGLDKTTARRTETTYDGRGGVATVTSYSKLQSNGLFDTSSDKTQTTYVYDQHGDLLSRVQYGSSASEVFVYDGLGRMTQATDFIGGVTRTSFLDARGQTILTHANGLSEVSTYNRGGELIAFSKSNAGGNLVDLTGWPGNPGSVPSGQATVAGWMNIGGYTDETQWASTMGPDGLQMVAIQAGQLDASEEGGGNFTHEMPIDASKAYEFSWQFKLSAMDKHYVFFGLSGTGPATVENLSDGADNTNPYFWYAIPGYQDTYLDPDKWYKVVGYVLPQGTPISSAPLGGVYDVATGQKVLDIYANFRWNPERPGNTVHSRFFDYYGQANQQYSTYFAPPEVRQVSTASVLGPDSATSLYRYDNLGRLRMTVDPTGRRNYLMYDSVGRKVADIDADGSVIEYRYDGSDNLTSTTRYVNKLSSGQIASLLDANGNPTSATFASLRPSAHADDQWTFQIYDAAQRLIQTIDGTGATSVFSYDGASRLVSTTQYANKLSGTVLTSLKAEASNPNNWANPNDGTLWAYYNLAQAAASPIDGANAYQFTVQASSWEAVVGNGLVTAVGDTISVTLSMKASGSTTSNSFGLLSTVTGWGDYANPDARGILVSGPGTVTQTGSYFYIQGLSTTEATRFTISRTFLAAETAYPYLFVDTYGAAAGASTILAAPVMSRVTPRAILPTADAANDRTTRSFYDADGRLIGSLDALGGLTQFFYDKGGRKIRELGSATAANSSYWASGTLAQLIASAGTSASDRRVDYVYDARGYLRFTIDAAARPIEMVYDGAGRVIRTVEYAGSIAAAASYSLAYVTAQLSSTGLATNGGNRITRTIYDAAGRPMFAIDATGSVVGFTYNSVGEAVKSIRYAVAYTVAGDQTLSTMQSWAAGQASNGANRLSRNVYDIFGRVAYEVDAENYVTEHRYDKAGRVTKDIRYAGTYTVSDGVTKESLAAQIGTPPGTEVVISYAYDADGLLSERTDSVGAITRFTYDSFGRVIDTIIAYNSAEATTTRRGYDVLGRVLTETRAFGTGIAATTSFAYDALGNLITVTDPRAYVTTRTYDTLGRVLTVSVPVDANSANNLVTTNQYDAFGNLAKVSQSALPDSANSYRYFDTLGRLVLDVDAERFWTRTAYTVFGEVASVTRGYVSVGSEPPVGTQPTTPTDAKDATTSFTYDKMSRLLSVADAQGNTESYAFDAFGDRKHIFNKAGGHIEYVYDKLGRRTYEYLYQKAWRPDGSVQQDGFYQNVLSYDSRGNVARRYEAYALTEQRQTDYTYDKADRLTWTTHDQVMTVAPDLVTTPYAYPQEQRVYSLRGELIQSVDAGGGKTLSYYDALGRKTTEVSAVGTLSAFTYDANGNILTTRVYGDAVAIPGSPGGTPPSPVNASNYRETGFTYDRANRLTTTTIANLRTGAFSGSTYAFTVGNVTGETVFSRYRVLREIDGDLNSSWTWFDKLGRKIAQVDREKYLTVWELDTNGNARTETRYAAQIGATITETTAAASLPGLAGTNAADRTTSFTYDKNGRRLTETRVGVLASSVSGTGALSSSTQNATITYTYNALGLVASKTEANSDLTQYEYDNCGRLIRTMDQQFVDNMGVWVTPTTEMFYDGLGNVVRSEVNKLGGAAADDRVSTFAYGAGGRLTSTTDAVGFTRYFYYDAAGRVVQEMHYRVRSDGSSTMMATGNRYDAAGRLVTQHGATRNGQTWVFGAATRIRYNSYGEVSGKGLTGSPDDAAAYQEVFDYDEGGRVWRSTAGDGAIKILFYDKAGHATLTLSSTGADLAGYTAATAAATIASAGGTSIAGAVTAIATFDKRGLQLQSLEPDRQLSYNGSFTTAAIKSTRTYNAFGEVLTEIDARGYLGGADPNNFKTDFTYNAMGRLTKKESAAVNWTSESGAVASARPTDEYYYDASGRLVGVRDANGNLTTRALLAGTGFGGAEPLVGAEFHADGGVFRTWYNVFGEAIVLADELGQWEIRGYDRMGRVTVVVQRGGLLTDFYTYDGLGQRTQHWNSLFGASYKERTDYDVEGRVTATIDMVGNATTYAYGWYSYLGTAGLGTFGGWEKITSYANGHASIDDTDYFGRTIWRSNLSGQAFTYSFDKGGRQTAEAGPSGYSKTFSWLNTGKLYQLVDAAGTGKNVITAKYGYDVAGNRTTEGYSGTVYSFYFPSGTTSSTLTLQNATIAYDALNRITSFTDKDAGGTTRITVTNEYDKNGNIRRNNSVFPNLAYPQYGNVNQDKWYRYDNMNRMVVVDGALTGGQIVRGALGYDVSYDVLGHRRTQTEDASLTGYAWTWVWYPGHGPGSGAPLEYPDEGNNGQYQEMPVYYIGERREEYDYLADGSLSNVKFAETGYTDNGDGTVSSTGVLGTGVLRAEYQRDAMGRISRYREFQADGATVSHDRYSIVYANQTFITSESVSQKKVESGVTNTYVTNTVNSYANGLLMSSTADEWKNGSDSAIPDTSTTNSYAWYDGAQLATSSFDSDTGSGSNTIFVSTYAYDGLGRVASVDIADGRRRTASFAYTPEGQVLSRKERATASTNPEDMRYFAGGVQIGELTSNGNNDPLLADYAQTVNTIRNWTPNPAAAPFRWNTTGGVTRGTFGAGSGYDPINPYGDGAQSTQSGYTVRGGETLQSIAANVWGDAAMWYLLASANGLTGGETLVAGQSLVIPDRVTNIHNNSSTFEVYDPNKAMGDLSPTTPKPPKKPGKCAVIGQILMVVIAVAVTIYTAGALTAAMGPVLAGAIGGAAGSVASQAFGMATGLQKKFDWKGVAMGAISGAVGGAVGPGGAFGKLGAFSSLSKVAGGVVQGALKGALTGLLTQGIAVATGLQKKFDWAGIAGDTIGGGITSSMGTRLDLAGAGYIGHGLTGAVSALASAGARSLIDGTNFGDNILAALPGVIGNTLGNMLADGVQGSGSRGELQKANAKDQSTAPTKKWLQFAAADQVPIPGQAPVASDATPSVAPSAQPQSGKPAGEPEVKPPVETVPKPPADLGPDPQPVITVRADGTRISPSGVPMTGLETKYDENRFLGHEDTHNCLAYAMDDLEPLREGFPHPGQRRGVPYQDGVNEHGWPILSDRTLRRAARADGLIYLGDDPATMRSPPRGTRVVAFFADTEGLIQDYHWARLDADGSWSHKRGMQHPSQVDDSGRRILDPRQADFDYGMATLPSRTHSGQTFSDTLNYRFIGYYAVRVDSRGYGPQVGLPGIPRTPRPPAPPKPGR
jgi:YD repeat-containing protein